MRPDIRHILTACLGFAITPAHGQGASAQDNLFLTAYQSWQSGESLESAGNTKDAVTAYQEAITSLDQLKRDFPTWKPDIVTFRRSQAVDAIARLTGKPAPGPTGQDKLIGELPKGTDGPIIPGIDDGGKSKKPRNTQPAPPPGTSAVREVQSLQDALSETKTKLERVIAENTDLAKKYDKAMKDAAESTAQRAKLEKRATLAEEALMKAEKEGGQGSDAANKARGEIEELRQQLRNVKIDRDAERELSEQYAQSLANVKSRITGAYAERDAAKHENTAFPGKIAEMQKQIDKVLNEKGDLTTKLAKIQEELGKVTGERDAAMQQIAKMKEAQKQVDKLMTDNTQLMAKLADAETQIKNFKAQGEDKDKQIAALKVEMGGVKQQLADAKKESATYQTQMSTLQTKLEAQAKELAQVKSDAVAGSAERKRLAEENETLRGIVVRQMKQQAMRDKTKQLVLTELAKLEIHSKALIDEIEFLGQPVVKLTDKEKKLFKQPQIEIADAEISISAPKEPAASAPDASAKIDETVPEPTVPDGKPVADANPPKTPDTKMVKADKPTTKVPPEGDLPVKSEDPAAKPADPAKMADANPPADATGGKEGGPSTNIPANSSGKSPATQPGKNANAGTTADNMTAPDTGVPAVPAELLGQAREAKDQFDKGNFRDAEKVYERILQKAPNNLYIISNLGVVRFREQKWKLAEESFKKAIAIAPEDAFSRCTLGIVEYSQGKYDEAVTELTKALAINPKNATAYNYLGITASQKGWQEAAQKQLETAVQLDPKYADAHFNLAVVFATQQPPDKDNARKHYKRAIELGAEPDKQLEDLIK